MLLLLLLCCGSNCGQQQGCHGGAKLGREQSHGQSKILFRVENKKNNEDNWPATYLGTKYIQPLLGPLVCLLAVGSSTE